MIQSIQLPKSPPSSFRKFLSVISTPLARAARASSVCLELRLQRSSHVIIEVFSRVTFDQLCGLGQGLFPSTVASAHVHRAGRSKLPLPLGGLFGAACGLVELDQAFGGFCKTPFDQGREL